MAFSEGLNTLFQSDTSNLSRLADKLNQESWDKFPDFGHTVNLILECHIALRFVPFAVNQNVKGAQHGQIRL